MAALSGIRIVDLGWAMAGPQATRLLADFGAEVIKVESHARPDMARTGFGPHVGEPGLENSGYANNFNRNKLSATVNLSKPEGREVFARLVGVADAVLENFSAGVMARWGFDYAGLKAIKPDIVYVSMAGLGQQGPYGAYQTFGPAVQALSGLVHQTGLPDRQPSGWGYSYMDHTGGYYAAMALLAALMHRRRTGEGQHIDLSQTEVAISLSGIALLDYAVNGRASTRVANRSPYPAMAPHGVYRCAPEPDGPIGDDEWVAIAVEGEEQWAALCRAAGHDEWRDDPRFGSLQARLAHLEELDCELESRTRALRKGEVESRLQASGVAAGRVNRSLDLIEHEPQLAHRGLYPVVEHAVLGAHHIDGMPARLSRTPPTYTNGSPLMGQDNAYVFGELLGMPAGEIERLQAEQVLW